MGLKRVARVWLLYVQGHVASQQAGGRQPEAAPGQQGHPVVKPQTSASLAPLPPLLGFSEPA